MKTKNRFNLAAQGKHLDIYLYGIIGGLDVDLQSFMAQLQSVDKPETITVYLNTLGGSFYDGIPIFTHLGMVEAKVTINIMGYALSMGSVIALAKGATVRMAQNGFIMIHRAISLSVGNAGDHIKQAEALQKHEVGITKLYAQRLGISADEALALMDETTWYTADEALAAGFIDEIIDPIDLSKAVNEAGLGSSDQADVTNLIGNYQHVPTQLNALLNGKPKHKGGLFGFLGIGKDIHKPKQTPSNHSKPPPDDIEMTPEELKALLTENNQILTTAIETSLEAKFEAKLTEKLAELKPKDEAVLQAEKIAELETQVAELKKPDSATRIAELEAEIADLKTPHNPTNVPENKGAGDEQQHYDC